jgi:hypothetical protein
MGSLRRSDDTGLTLYAILRNASHQVVVQSSGAVESYNASNWANYDHAAVEQGATGYYYIATSDDIAAGVYWVEWKYQSGASPAVSDVIRASGAMYWNGTAWYAATVNVGDIATDAIDADAISAAAVTKVQSGLATAADVQSAKLAADGLDAITATEPTGKPTTFRGWLMWLVQRQRCAAKTPTSISVKTEAGATVTTQVVTDDGNGTENLGAPS